MAPRWIADLSAAWICVCVLCSLALVALELRRPPKMPIMAVVWPITAWYYGPIAIWAFLKNEGAENKSRAQQTFDAVTHCGAGCTIGDILGEWSVYAATWVVGNKLGAEYVVDFGLAFLLGIVFQYFTIAPMRGLGLRDGIIAALKADTLSLIAFELGLFGWMALTRYVLFPYADTPTTVHWFMMQVGMIVGFWTAYPMNALLLRWGLKEPM